MQRLASHAKHFKWHLMTFCIKRAINAMAESYPKCNVVLWSVHPESLKASPQIIIMADVDIRALLDQVQQYCCQLHSNPKNIMHAKAKC